MFRCFVFKIKQTFPILLITKRAKWKCYSLFSGELQMDSISIWKIGKALLENSEIVYRKMNIISDVTFQQNVKYQRQTVLHSRRISKSVIQPIQHGGFTHIFVTSILLGMPTK